MSISLIIIYHLVTEVYSSLKEVSIYLAYNNIINSHYLFAPWMESISLAQLASSPGHFDIPAFIIRTGL